MVTKMLNELKVDINSEGWEEEEKRYLRNDYEELSVLDELEMEEIDPSNQENARYYLERLSPTDKWLERVEADRKERENRMSEQKTPIERHLDDTELKQSMITGIMKNFKLVNGELHVSSATSMPCPKCGTDLPVWTECPNCSAALER